MPRWRNTDTVLPAATSGQPRALNDAYGRVATDLRVSLTDRCNLRCTYCMPAEGLEWLPAAEVLDDAEIIRLVGIGVRLLGITTVRLTGGEPLLRKNLEALVAEPREARPQALARLDDQRNRLGQAGGRAGRRRTQPDQHLTRHSRSRDVRALGPSATAARRARRRGGRPAGGPGAGEDQHCADARHQ